ncbi:MAG: tRNA adenosine(34) deaminase TadA [Candidatus Omnitrophica bacterium]|nr:tRNA adenosine(34) deaminase TadA [Candidatus Omnitrophota bacterium]
MKIDKIYMQEALKEARKAFEEDEVPIGAVIVYNRKIIARAHNQVKRLHDPTAHAEMLAITQAADYLRNERLINASIYVTIEPCIMCIGAMVLGRINRLIYGTPEPKTGACGSTLDIPSLGKLNHHLKITRDILPDECSHFLKEFFKKKRSYKP